MADPATTMVIGVILISMTAGVTILSLAEELQGRADTIANETAQWGGRVADAIHGLYSEGKTLHGDYPDLVAHSFEVNDTITYYQTKSSELEELNETISQNQTQP
jgi:hypothetical protein